MDESTIASLKNALAASPDNIHLKLVVLEALSGNGDTEAMKPYLDQIKQPGEIAEDQRLTLAKYCLEVEMAEKALVLAAGQSAKSKMMRCRALSSLKRPEEALSLYQEAVAETPALEEPDLLLRLQAEKTSESIATLETEDQGGLHSLAEHRRAKLRVIANDDTDKTEVTRLIAPAEEKVTFADVGGHEVVKEQIRKKIILPFQKPKLFEKFRKRIGGGILMYGPPGVGKTLLARATAGEVGAHFINVDIADVLDMYIGESERKLHTLFQQARDRTPSVLFFDELEALGGKRQYSREGTASKLVSQFLSEMDGFSKGNEGVLILGATNVPWAIDPAFRRPGRFDRVQFVPPPDRAARATILKLHLDKRPAEASLDYETLAVATQSFSGADLMNLVETAADFAIEASLDEEKEVLISTSMLKRAMKDVKPTTLEWLTTARNYANYANESGQYDDVLDFLKKHSKS